MDFELTAEQAAVRDRVRAFAVSELAPHYQEADRAGTPRRDLHRVLAQHGLTGLRIPRAYGGAGSDCVTTGAAMAEVARADVNAGYVVVNCSLIGDVVVANGDDAQRGRWLPAIAAGDALPALCLTEREHGSDAARIEATARRDGARWRISGLKTSIALGAHATHAVVFARTGGEGAGGVTAFYVALDDAHVERRVLSDLGNRSIGRAELSFDGLPADDGDVLGGEGLGFKQVMRGFDYSRALIALMAVSVAQAAVDDALDRLRERRAFGQPLGRFQGASFPLVEHATYLRAARHLCFEALWRKDRGLDHTVHANMAKWWGPRAAVDAIHQALLTFGHFGYSDELPHGQRLRDVIGLEIADGTAQIAKLVVARALLGRDHAP
ncbi:MAG TPA: acyl-CoA dehydrogenase family protein [Actinomycetota bacterium]|nr:acyl-CoA dehydrogenase family protein [Actinomycetota bacterium]